METILLKYFFMVWWENQVAGYGNWQPFIINRSDACECGGQNMAVNLGDNYTNASRPENESRHPVTPRSIMNKMEDIMCSGLKSGNCL